MSNGYLFVFLLGKDLILFYKKEILTCKKRDSRSVSYHLGKIQYGCIATMLCTPIDVL